MVNMERLDVVAWLIDSWDRCHADQVINGLWQHGRMGSQGNQVIQLCGALSKLLVEQAEHQGYRSRACPVRNDHQDALVGRVKPGSDEELLICSREQLLYILGCQRCGR